jgi:pSer/pThr/pTyr-binding forkhead associated (FHA) protein
MPILRIPFPETGTPTTVTLRGDRLTIGRRPDNTIQVRDRTVSAYHAELISEGDHYRLHDTASTNAVRVNGQVVTDFHLTEACKIMLGSVICEFSLETPTEEPDPRRALMTHAEADTLRREAAEMKTRITTLEADLAGFRLAEGEGPEAELARAMTEKTRLADQLNVREAELAKLRNDFAVLQRDRDHLDRALAEQRKIAAAKPGAVTDEAETVSFTPTPQDAQPVFVKAKPAVLPAAAAAPSPAPSHVTAKPTAMPKPAMPKPAVLPQPSAAPPQKPLTSAPKAVLPVQAGPKGTQKIAV